MGKFVFLIIFLAADRFLHKKFPGFYKKTEFPALIIMSVIIAVYCGALIHTVFDMLNSGVSNDDKVFYVVFIAIIVAIYVALALMTWKKWLKDRKKD